MRTSMFAFASDLADEGCDSVLGNLQDRAGVDSITFGAAYHAARDIFPHNPRRKVRFLEPGAFFHPQPERYPTLRPPVSELAQERDLLAETCTAARRRGMTVNAWTVFLHNDRLGFEHPDCAPSNAFGDPYLTDLCPSHPDVRAYTLALVSDLTRYDLDTIRAESLHFHGLEHGYHHERYFEDIDPLGTFLLGLCFCQHCMAAARDRGVDADGVKQWVRGDIERRLTREMRAAPEEELEREHVAWLANSELGGYLEARTDTVTSLAREASQRAAAGGVGFTFIDLSGVRKGFADGKPTGSAAPATAWREGIDAGHLARVCDRVQVAAYARDLDRVHFDLEAYRHLVPEPAQLALIMRPMPPDCHSAEDLAAKVALAQQLAIEELDFYHYGFSRLSRLDWIREACQSPR